MIIFTTEISVYAGKASFALWPLPPPWHLARLYVGIWFCSKFWLFFAIRNSCSYLFFHIHIPGNWYQIAWHLWRCFKSISNEIQWLNFQPHLHGLPAYLTPKELIPDQNIDLYSKKMMGLINMLFIVIAVQVLFLVCLPAHEARRILYAENKNVINNYPDKLFWEVQQGEASLNVPNPATTGDISSSMISQKALFATDHNIDVSPLPFWLLLNGYWK